MIKGEIIVYTCYHVGTTCRNQLALALSDNEVFGYHMLSMATVATGDSANTCTCILCNIIRRS